MYELIGIAGKAGSGKDTVAEYIEPFGYRRRALADNIKFIARFIYDLEPEQMNDPQLKEQPLDEWDGLTPRQILQRLGTEVGRSVHEETWVRSLFHWIDDHWEISSDWGKGYVIPDVRFPNEAKAIRDKGGRLWFVEREESGTISGEGHESESHFEELREMADVIIENDDGHDKLYRQVYEVIPDE